MFKKFRAMKKKDKFDEYDDGRITTDDYVDLKCGMEFCELLLGIFVIILIVVLP